MRISSSFVLPDGQFDKNLFATSLLVCFDCELEFEFLSFMVTFAIIIIVCRVQWLALLVLV